MSAFLARMLAERGSLEGAAAPGDGAAGESGVAVAILARMDEREDPGGLEAAPAVEEDKPEASDRGSPEASSDLAVEAPDRDEPEASSDRDEPEASPGSPAVAATLTGLVARFRVGGGAFAAPCEPAAARAYPRGCARVDGRGGAAAAVVVVEEDEDDEDDGDEGEAEESASSDEDMVGGALFACRRLPGRLGARVAAADGRCAARPPDWVFAGGAGPPRPRRSFDRAARPPLAGPPEPRRAPAAAARPALARTAAGEFWCPAGCARAFSHAPAAVMHARACPGLPRRDGAAADRAAPRAPAAKRRRRAAAGATTRGYFCCGVCVRPGLGGFHAAACRELERARRGGGAYAGPVRVALRLAAPARRPPPPPPPPPRDEPAASCLVFARLAGRADDGRRAAAAGGAPRRSPREPAPAAASAAFEMDRQRRLLADEARRWAAAGDAGAVAARRAPRPAAEPRLRDEDGVALPADVADLVFMAQVAARRSRQRGRRADPPRGGAPGCRVAPPLRPFRKNATPPPLPVWRPPDDDDDVASASSGDPGASSGSGAPPDAGDAARVAGDAPGGPLARRAAPPVD